MARESDDAARDPVEGGRPTEAVEGTGPTEAGEEGAPEAEEVIRRILVAIDASAHSLAALAAAATLAAGLRAELEGLFVEDVGLLRLAGHSLAREVDALSAKLTPLESREMERQLRLQASRARQALRRAAEPAQVRWSFRTARGRVSPELKSAASSADLVIVGLRGWSPGRGPGSTAWSLLRQPPPLVMVMGRAARLGRSVFALVSDAPSSTRALRLAATLSEATGLPLTVLLDAPEEEARARLSERAAAELARRGTPAELRPLESGARARLEETLRAEGCGLLVVPRPRSEPPAEEESESVRRLLAAMDCPVLLVA